MEIYYCPMNCEYLQGDKKSSCKLGYENKRNKLLATFIRPDRCVQDELAERETFEREE